MYSKWLLHAGSFKTFGPRHTVSDFVDTVHTTGHHYLRGGFMLDTVQVHYQTIENHDDNLMVNPIAEKKRTNRNNPKKDPFFEGQ